MTKQYFSEPFVLEFVEKLEPDVEALLLNGINFYAKQKKKMSDIQHFSVFLKDTLGKHWGGLSGHYCYGCMHINLLWIDGTVRGSGWGKKIMHEAERQAKARGCNFSTLETMDWEALPFYQKLGYTVEFVRNGYQNASVMYLMRKEFKPGLYEKPLVEREKGW